MTVLTGNNVTYGSGGYYDARISYTLTNTSDSNTRVVWELYVYYSTSLYDSTNNAKATGDLKNATYGSKSYSSSGSGTMTYASGTTNFARGASAQSKSQQFYIEALAEGSGGGARSTVTYNFTIPAKPAPPAVVPSAPAPPTIDAVDYSGAWATLIEPDSGTASIDLYQVQVSPTSGFASIIYDATFRGEEFRVDNCAPSTLYYMRVRAHNSVGWGLYSTSTGAPFTTLTAPSGNVFYTKQDGVWHQVMDDYYKTIVGWDDISNPQPKVSGAWDT